MLKAGSTMGSHRLAQSFIQLGLKNLQGWRLHNLLGQPFPTLDCLHGEKTSPYIQDRHAEAGELFEPFLLADALQVLQKMAAGTAVSLDAAFSLTMACLHLQVFLPINQAFGLVMSGLPG